MHFSQQRIPWTQRQITYTYPNTTSHVPNRQCTPLKEEKYDPYFGYGRPPDSHRQTLTSFPQPCTQTEAHQSKQAHTAENQNMLDVVKFMACHEIVATGLLQFDDQPENYRAWKASFLSATRDLNLTAKEEMDLLVKWLGAQSGEQVKHIRAVHVNNPIKGLQMVWERLNEWFGTPEVIENSLLRRVDNFPNITNKDCGKLRELGDLLMELQAAKSEGALSGLTYLDTARGITGIVQKLPVSLQEKWMTLGYAYKQKYRVSFPPFSVLVDFISQQAKMRNDPSFNLPPSTNHSKTGIYTSKRVIGAPVSVRKTEVATDLSLADETKKSKVDPEKQCPIHKKLHPLRKCRGFREKPIEDRKAFLKQNGICFKCVASTTHLARDCDESVKCTECDSERHHSVLHPGPPPWSSKTL